jgi:DNA-binding transcriptional ArsR family regulator
MPLSINDTFDIPYHSAPVQVALEPARSAVQSLLMLTDGHHKNSPADWVIETKRAMSPEERKRNNLVLLGLHYVVQPMETWNDFPAYVDHLAASQPEALRDKMLDVYQRESFNPHPEGTLLDLQTALTSPENYLTYLRQRFHPDNVDEAIEREAYRYVMDPPALQKLVVDHLRHMWDRYLSAEWERVRSTLQTVVQAYQKVDLKGKSFLEAGRLITGQELDEAKWAPLFANARRLIFVPHPHVGPYIPKCFSKDQEIIIFFIAHLPDWMAKDTPDLTRTEIAIRLSALADDTRLRILRYIAENGEQRSQEIMDALDLSQSATSRHLSQLSAGGFVSERRCDGAKCYALNTERVADTLQAIASFLSVPAQERIRS